MLRLAIAALGFACINRTATVTSTTGDEWYVVTTPHVRLETDLSRRYVEDRAATLEHEIRALFYLYQLLGPRQPPTLRPAHVVLFADCDSYKRFAHRSWEDAAGFARDSFDLEDARVVVTCDDVVIDQRYALTFRNGLFRHELAHVLNAYYFGGLPQWLNEGLAEYFEGVRVTGDVAEVGHPPIPWLVWGSRERGAARSLDSIRGQAWEPNQRNYHFAWKAVHAMLNSSPASRDRTMQYLARIAGGAGEPEAWKATIAAIEPDVRRTYDTWKPLATYNTWKIPLPKFPAPPPKVRAMTPIEVASRLVELAVSTSDATTISPALTEALANLGRVDPSGDRVLLWRALIAYRTRNRSFGEPKALFESYVARRPDDAQGHLGRFLTAFHALRSSPSDAQRDEELAALEPSVVKLVPLLGTPEGLLAVAQYWIARRKIEAGVPYLKRAIDRDPGCSGCFETLAFLLHAEGSSVDAVRAQERAIALRGDDFVTADMHERLATYRAAATAQPPRP